MFVVGWVHVSRITIKHAWYVSAAFPRDGTPLTSNAINIIIIFFYLACALM